MCSGLRLGCLWVLTVAFVSFPAFGFECQQPITTLSRDVEGKIKGEVAGIKGIISGGGEVDGRIVTRNLIKEFGDRADQLAIRLALINLTCEMLKTLKIPDEKKLEELQKLRRDVMSTNLGMAPAASPSDVSNDVTLAGLRFVVQGASQERDQGRSTTTLRLAVTNVTKEPVQIVWAPKPSITDNLGSSQFVTRMVGHRICERPSGQQDKDPKECAYFGRNEAAVLSPDVPSMVSMRFGGGFDRQSDAELRGTTLSFAGTALLLTERAYRVISVSMASIPLQR